MSNHPQISPVSPPGSQPAPTGPAARRGGIKWILLGAVLLLIGYVLFLRPAAPRIAGPGRGGMGAGPTPVSAESARRADLNIRLAALGTVTPVQTVTIRSRVDGELQKLYFTEGTHVVAGAPLAEIDPRPFAVLKLQAEAQLAKDSALLENARVDLKRYQTLLEQDSVASQQVDTQVALVHQFEAALKVDQAQVESAALQLAYAHIIAPISGRIGLRGVDQGNMVHAGDANGIAVITQLQPITVIFSIPQDAIPAVLKSFATGDDMSVEAFDRDGHTRLAAGRLLTVDNQIDPTTGTVKLRAEFANKDETLFPNQFVNVQLIVGQLAGATVIPAAAVQRGTIGNYVYVVQDGKTVTMRPVETGPTEQGQIAISKGLAPGEQVVVDGVDKLREGAEVELVSRTTGAKPAGQKARPEGGWSKRPKTRD
jgi:multidrug efflux system membrane fusion protein